MIYLLIITPFVGGAIYGALFVMAGGMQFFLIDGAEFTSAFVYGGSYAGQLPGSVLLEPIRVLFTFVIPATATAYLPALISWACPARRSCRLVGLVRAAVRGLGLGAGPAGLARGHPQVHRSGGLT